MPGDHRSFYCAHCGESVPEDARSCPHCGSDADTGWAPEDENDSIEIPEDDDGDAEPGAERPGVSGAFMVLLMIVAALGVVAVAGLAGLPGALFTLLGALVVIAYVAGRFRRRPPVR